MINRQGLCALSEMKDYKVSDEDPDVRGWEVVADGQRIGTVRDLLISPERMKVEYFDLGGGDQMLVPAASSRLDPASRRVLVSGYGDYRRTQSDALHATRAHEDAHLTRAEEELRIGKREVEAGEVVVGKHVDTERVRQEVPVERERVRVERRPVTEGYAGAEIGTDEIRVPVVEEELVVEKRAVVKEELVISKDRVTDIETVETDVRRERFEVEGDSSLIDESPGTRGRKEH